MQLKNEGNQLHSQGKYQEACAKYEKAKSNVLDNDTKEAADLRKACTLNLSSCYLNLQQYSKCVEQCNEVLSGTCVYGQQAGLHALDNIHMAAFLCVCVALSWHNLYYLLRVSNTWRAAGESANLKALYRRGQALAGLKKWLAAEADLKGALKLCAGDPVQAKPIREKLQEVKDQISSIRAAGGALEPITAGMWCFAACMHGEHVPGTCTPAWGLGMDGSSQQQH